MKYASLFSGIGGFDLGFDLAGMECVLQAESDQNCLNILLRQWPDVKKVNDVKKVKRVSADVICGGFPCQDVSVAGKRAGLAGKRSGLWFEFHRIIERNLPRWVVVENVPGLLSSNEGRDFATLLRGLVECGYGVSWRILDAQYFGLAQRRRRVFIVGSLGSGRSAQVLFESESMSGDSPSSRETGQETPAVSGTLPASGSGTSRPGGQGAELDFYVPLANTLGSHHGHNDPSNGDTLLAWNWQSGGDVRHDFDDKPMLQSSQVPAVGVRRLTPTECERLQGFPDGFTDGQSDSVRYRHLGNAVAVPCAEWVARRILDS